MGITAPIFYDDVVNVVDLCAARSSRWSSRASRSFTASPSASDAFPAIGTIPKGAWLAILGVCLLLTLLGFGGGAISIFGLIGIAAALIYLLDVRAGLRDLTDGKGFW